MGTSLNTVDGLMEGIEQLLYYIAGHFRKGKVRPIVLRKIFGSLIFRQW